MTATHPSIIRPTGSTILISMTDLDRTEGIDVSTATGTIRLDGCQVDPASGLYLGAERHPHQGIVIGVGPRASQAVRVGQSVMAVADLGSRWDHEGMTVQHVRSVRPCQCGRDTPTDPIFALLDDDGPKAPTGRVIVEPSSAPRSESLEVLGSLGESLLWGEVVSVGGDVHPELTEGVRVAYTVDGGFRWSSGGVDYVSLRARARGCRCGRPSASEVVAIDLGSEAKA